VLSAIALVLLAWLVSAFGAPIKVGDQFPALDQFKLEGQLPDASSAKVVIVDFWASWCGPCKASFPVMEELHQQFGKQGLQILAVNVDENRAAMDDFLKQHRVSFPVVRDAGQQLVAAAAIGSMPTSFILDGGGRVRAMHNGFHGDKTRKQYVDEIQALLNATP
jgi:thiol-disulfide isomerase/thioredoxin